jgi:hypothetical protein
MSLIFFKGSKYKIKIITKRGPKEELLLLWWLLLPYVHLLLLVVILRTFPNMDTVGDQARRTTITEGQQRKIERDKTRARRGNVQRKRLHVLRNPSKLAFRG